MLLNGPSLVSLIRFLLLLLLDLVSRYSLSGLYRDPWSAQIKRKVYPYFPSGSTGRLVDLALVQKDIG